MIGQVNIEEQVDQDFGRARRKALLRRALAWLRWGTASATLPCFEEARRSLGAVGGTRLGQRAVRLSDIVGSVGRCPEFDPEFLPARPGARTRWGRVDRAFHQGVELPPVSLYELGGHYFVEDGNHRVSVARFHGVEMIEAEITAFRAPAAARPERG